MTPSQNHLGGTRLIIRSRPLHGGVDPAACSAAAAQELRPDPASASEAGGRRPAPRPSQRPVCARGWGTSSPRVPRPRSAGSGRCTRVSAREAVFSRLVAPAGRPVPAAEPGHPGSETCKARPAGRQVSCQQANTGEAVGRPLTGLGWCSCADFGLAAAVAAA